MRSKSRRSLSLSILICCLVLAIAHSANAESWIQLNPTPDPVYGSPEGRSTHTAVYNPDTNRMIMFAGYNGSASYTGAALNDLWVLTNADGTGGTPAWIRLNPSGGPSPRYNHVAVYDPSTNRMIVHAGHTNPGNCQGVVGDVWVLINADGTGGAPQWIASTTGPADRAASAAYDSTNNKLIVWGVHPSACGNNEDITWVLSNANAIDGTGQWSQLLPTNTIPNPNFANGPVGYDPDSNTLVALAWNGADSPHNDFNTTRLLSGANGLGVVPAWTDFAFTGIVPQMSYTRGVYDAGKNMMLISGGYDYITGQTDSATWRLDNANGQGGAPSWVQLTPSGTLPPGRMGSSAVYNPVTARMIIFAGYNGDTKYNDIWVLSNQYTLTANSSGNSAGTVSSAAAGISYTYPTTATGSTNLTYGTQETLTATTSTGSTVSWTGCDTSGGTATAATCTITNIHAAKTVTAIFSINQYALTANSSGNGTGSVSSNTGNISYTYPTTATGSANLDYGTPVTLTATAAAGSTVAWSGCDSTGGTSTSATCVITSINTARNVIATFTLQQYSLTVDAFGSGAGAVSSSVGGINYSYPAGNSGSANFVTGTAVTLTATATVGSTVAWSGACDSTGGTSAAATCVINSMAAARTVAATFTAHQYSLTANATGNGAGTVTSNIGTISFVYPTISSNSTMLNSGATVTLTAMAVAGSQVSWSGNCSSTGGTPIAATCTISNLASSRTVTATFTLSQSYQSRIGVFRPSGGIWFLDYPGTGAWVGCGTTPTTDRCYTGFGIAGDIPVVGDWNGDGRTKIGAYRNGTWYLDYPGTGAWVGCGGPIDPTKDACYVGAFGAPGDIPVVGKW